MAVEIRVAGDGDRSTIERLIQLYLYDMASEHPWPIEPDGRYGYDFLDRFWQHPYLVFSNGELAGFALVIRGCPITGAADPWFMAEFFVLRPYRRRGIGREAVQLVLANHPGPWHVAVLETNAPAQKFWSNALSARSPVARPASHDGDQWLVNAFSSRQ